MKGRVSMTYYRCEYYSNKEPALIGRSEEGDDIILSINLESYGYSSKEYQGCCGIDPKETSIFVPRYKIVNETFEAMLRDLNAAVIDDFGIGKYDAHVSLVHIPDYTKLKCFCYA